MRKVQIGIAVCLIALSLFGCNNNDTLPNDIADVGGELVKDEELLDETNPDYQDNETPAESGAENQDGDVCLSGITSEYASIDDIKTWIADEVSGEYTSTPGASENDVSSEATTLTTGERVDILFYGDVYFMTELYLEPDEDVASLKTKTVDFLAAYIGRNLTDQEADDVETAIEVGLKGGEMGYVESLGNTATVYTMIQNEKLLVQIR